MPGMIQPEASASLPSSISISISISNQSNSTSTSTSTPTPTPTPALQSLSSLALSNGIINSHPQQQQEQQYIHMRRMVPATSTPSSATVSSNVATCSSSNTCIHPTAIPSTKSPKSPSSSPSPSPSPPPSSSSSSSSLSSSSSSSPPPFFFGGGDPQLKSEERGLLIIQLLMKCAGAVAAGHMDYINLLLEQLSALVMAVAPSLLSHGGGGGGGGGGDPMQRVASHFMEALAARAIKTWPGIYRALNCTQLPSQLCSHHQDATHLFFNLCPYLKFAFTIVNHSILEAMENERVVHIIDLGGTAEFIQWVTLLQMLATRIGGPPHLRITIVNQRKEALDQVGQKLCEEAESLDIPFQFNPVLLAQLQDLEAEMLKVKTGEAVAISSVLQLHYLLSEEEEELEPQRAADLNGSPHRITRNSNPNSNPNPNPILMHRGYKVASRGEKVLYMLRSLGPKVMVVMEQESKHNGADFMERFVTALHYYAAMFDSLEGSLTVKQSRERMAMEKHVLGRQIHNIVACEGAARVERHESIHQWERRLRLVGLVNVPFPYSAKLHANHLLLSCGSYRLAQPPGLSSLSLCWHDTPLFTLSAWQPT